MTAELRDIKILMSGIESRLANDDVFTMRRTLDELVLAMNLLVRLVEGLHDDFPAAAPERSPRPPAAGPNLFENCSGARWFGGDE